VFGFTAPIYVVVLFSGSKYREYLVEPDAFVQSVYVAEVEKFLELVSTDQAPDFDGSTATLQTVREINPDIHAEAEAELGELANEYYLAQAQFEDGEKALNLAKARILDEMGLAKRGLVNGQWLFTRQSRNGGTPFLVARKA
jgi:hypothetical protein